MMVTYRNSYGELGSWSSGISVQNVSNVTTGVTIYYYDEWGAYLTSSIHVVNPFSVVTVYPLPISNARSSASILADYDIAVVVNHVRAPVVESEDGFGSHTAFNR